jgi:hypothetical protein
MLHAYAYAYAYAQVYVKRMKLRARLFHPPIPPMIQTPGFSQLRSAAVEFDPEWVPIRRWIPCGSCCINYY